MMLGFRSKLPTFLIFASALFIAACGDEADPPAAMTGGSGTMSTAGTTSGGVATGGSSAGASSAGTGTSGGSTGGTSETGGAAGLGGSGGSSDGGSSGESSGGAGGAGGTAGSGGGGAGGTGGAPAFQPCPTSGPCKIMPYGDSITQGYNVAGGYRAPLFGLALAANRNITFVGSANDYSVPDVNDVPFPKNHEGHGAHTIEGNNGIAKFASTSIPSYKPHIITLMIGTNDINGNINVAEAPNRLGKLLDAIHALDENILVVLAQIVPTDSDGTNNAVKTYNAAMPNLVSTRVAQGRHIILVDMYGAFTKDPSYKNTLLADKLHPNQAGYNLMAEVWFEALSPYLP